MRAKHARTIRIGLRFGRASAIIATIICKERYPVHRGKASDLQWDATVHAVRRQLRGTPFYAASLYRDVLTIRDIREDAHPNCRSTSKG